MLEVWIFQEYTKSNLYVVYKDIWSKVYYKKRNGGNKGGERRKREGCWNIWSHHVFKWWQCCNRKIVSIHSWNESQMVQMVIIWLVYSWFLWMQLSNCMSISVHKEKFPKLNVMLYSKTINRRRKQWTSRKEN